MPTYEVETPEGVYEVELPEGVQAPPDTAGSASPSLPGYEQARLGAEQGIAERPSAIDFMRQVAQNPQLAQQHPFRTGLSALSAPFEAGESIPANIGLALQRGDLRQLPQELWQGISGQRPSQIGDIYRASGVPALQAIAAPAGLLLTGGTGGLKSRLATPPQGIMDAAMRPALQAAQGIRTTTALPSMASQQVLGQVPKVGGLISDRVVKPASKALEPITQFPYRKSLEVRQGLIGYFRKINDQYGDELDKLSQNLQGVIPAQQIQGAFRARLQAAGVLDAMGKAVPDRLASMTRIEHEVWETYENLSTGLATNPNAMLPFKDVVTRLRQLRGTMRQQSRQRNVPINADEHVVSGLLHDLGTLIQPNAQGPAAKSLENINRAYAQQRQVFDMGNRIFKVFKGDFDTKGGERVMTGYHKLDQGTRELLDVVERETGVPFVKAAKARSAVEDVTQLPGLPQTIRAALGIGRLAGIAGAEVAGAPFKASGQVQQAAIRELLKIVGSSGRGTPSPQ